MNIETTQDADLLQDGAMQISQAVEWSGLGRTKLYEAMAGGRLRYVKHGKRRLIPKKALRDYLAEHLEDDSRPTE